MRLFQSLIGFKINWNDFTGALSTSEAKFQSLIGFKINWNIKNAFPGTQLELFQSLIGFKINWNDPENVVLAGETEVSIPNRV